MHKATKIGNHIIWETDSTLDWHSTPNKCNVIYVIQWKITDLQHHPSRYVQLSWPSVFIAAKCSCFRFNLDEKYVVYFNIALKRWSLLEGTRSIKMKVLCHISARLYKGGPCIIGTAWVVVRFVIPFEKMILWLF